MRHPPHKTSLAPPETPAPTVREPRRMHVMRTRLLAVLVALLVVAGLKWSAPVTMPIAFAIFVIAAVWPVKAKLDEAVPPAFSYVFTLLVLLAIFGAFIGGSWYAIDRAVATLTRDQGDIQSLVEQVAGWAEQRGLPSFDSQRAYGRLVGMAQALLATVYTALGYIGLIAVLVILGLPDAPGFARRLRQRLDGDDRRETFDAIFEIAGRFRSYVGVTLVTSLLSGIGAGAWCYAFGLELAFVWGVLNFLMNFVPVIGNIIGIIPPTLYALLQFDGWTMPAVIFVGLAVILISISNFVYPTLQGRGLALPAVTIVVALTFWGWVWGFGGVLLAVPMTAAVIIACDHFRDTRWVAHLLSRDR